MPTLDTTFYEKKKSRFFSGTLIFLGLIIIGTLSLFFYKSMIEKENTNIQSEIQKITGSISEVERNPQVQVYKIYAEHKGFLTLLADNSRISFFVAHLKKTFRKYNLEATGFNYANNKVTVQVKGQTNDAGYAYEKVVKFLREYNGETEEKNPFYLQKIMSFAGYDTMNYVAEFQVKN